MARVVFCAWSKEAAAGSNLMRWRHQYPFKILQNSWETTHVSGWKVDIMCLGHKWGPSRDSGGRQMSSPIQNVTRNPKEPWNFARPLVHHGLIASKNQEAPPWLWTHLSQGFSDGSLKTNMSHGGDFAYAKSSKSEHQIQPTRFTLCCPMHKFQPHVHAFCTTYIK